MCVGKFSLCVCLCVRAHTLADGASRLLPPTSAGCWGCTVELPHRQILVSPSLLISSFSNSPAGGRSELSEYMCSTFRFLSAAQQACAYKFTQSPGANTGGGPGTRAVSARAADPRTRACTVSLVCQPNHPTQLSWPVFWRMIEICSMLNAPSSRPPYALSLEFYPFSEIQIHKSVSLSKHVPCRSLSSGWSRYIN